MLNLDDPELNYTHEERREHFIKSLAVSLDRFNMKSVGDAKYDDGTVIRGSASDAAVAEYLRLKSEEKAKSVGIMEPHCDSILWIFGDRMGRYLVYPFEKKNAVHICFGFCPRPVGTGRISGQTGELIERYSVTNRPNVQDTFQLKVSLTSGYKFWDSRTKLSAFTAMKDEFTFCDSLRRLIFDGDMAAAVAYLGAIKQRLAVMKD